jgi:voltage-gated sodium channel
MRITRLFKLMKSKTFESFNKIIRTLIFSFPALFNVLLLLILIYFIFAILGVFLFRDVDTNFENFGTAILNLFRFSTGEDWHIAMYSLSDKKPIIS